MEYVIIIIAAVFVSNIVLNQFLGICPFIGVSSKVETAIGMTGAVTFVMVIATLVTYLIYHSVLVPFDMVLICAPSPSSWSSPPWFSWWRSS
jgi:electron transport complex protein RnfA